jgi:hypothetical protein
MNTDHIFIHVVDGKFQCYESLSGIDRRNHGPRWSSPAEAKAYIERLSTIPETTPLRTPTPSDAAESSSLGAVEDSLPRRRSWPDATFEDETRVSASSTAGTLWDPLEGSGG